MQESRPPHLQNESPAYEFLTLLKVFKTKSEIPYAFHHGGGISNLMKLKGLNPTSITESEMESLFAQIESVFDFIPPVIASIQFVGVKKKRTLNVFNDDQKVPKLIRAREVFFNHLADDNQIFEYDFYLSIYMHGETVSMTEALRNRIKGLFDKTKVSKIKMMNAEFYGVADKLAILEESSKAMASSFDKLGMQLTQVMSVDEYYQIYSQFTRPTLSKFKTISIKPENQSPRQELFAGVRAKIFSNHFVLDDVYHKIYSLEKAPDVPINGGDIFKIFNAPAEMFYSFTFQKLDKELTRKRVDRSIWKKKLEVSKTDGDSFEDEFAKADLARVKDEYERMANGNSLGAVCSGTLCLKLDKSYVERKARQRGVSEKEFVRSIESDLQLNGFNQFGRSDWANEEAGAWASFCKMIPGFGEVNGYFLKAIFMAMNDVPYFLPIFSTANEEHFDGLNAFIDKSGAAYPFNVLDKQLPAWNWCITGQTGSGKSVIINTIITQELGRYYKQRMDNQNAKHPVICIMDVGGEANSFSKNVSMYNGEIINLSTIKKPYIQLLEISTDMAFPKPDKKKELINFIMATHSIEQKQAEAAVISYFQVAADKMIANMNEYEWNLFYKQVFGSSPTPGTREKFTLSPGDAEPNSSQMNLILSVLEIMLSNSTKRFDVFETGEFHREKVKALIYDVYRATKSRFPYISEIIEHMNSNLELNEDGKEFIQRLSGWTRDSAYPMFDLDTDINLSKDIILVDFKGIENDPHLQAIYTLMFSKIFSEKMYKLKDRRRLLIRDEAWKMLANSSARNYFFEDLRTARKHGFATISSTQTVAEYLNPDPQLGINVLGQMTGHIIGRYEDTNVDSVSEILKLSPEIARSLPRLGTVKEKGVALYSTFVVKKARSYNILTNRLHPFEQSVYSSDADDNFIIDYYKSLRDPALQTLEDIIEFLAEGGHFGDKNLVKHLMDSGKEEVARRIARMGRS